MTDDLASSLQVLISLLEAQRLRYMVVGSVAALAHGRARSTQDVDVVVELSLAHVGPLVSAFPPDRFYVSEDAARDAVRRSTLFNVIDMTTGWKLDLHPRPQPLMVSRCSPTTSTTSRRGRASLLRAGYIVLGVPYFLGRSNLPI
ncbi:MAG: hypothetical protein AAGN82_11840 [Myxococcota bacterium]